MSGFFTAAATVCASGVVCALLSAFVTDGSMKRVLCLVIGAFMVCSFIVPFKNALSSISLEQGEYPSHKELTATADEAVNREVLTQTKENLQNTLTGLLRQNGIAVNETEVVLAQEENNRIIIGSVCIYIGEESADSASEITSLTRRHFGITPVIYTE